MTIDLSLLPDGGISWADASGPDGHIVLSTRIRLARNLQGTTFTIRARDEDRERIREQVVGASREIKSLADAAVFRVEGLDRADRLPGRSSYVASNLGPTRSRSCTANTSARPSWCTKNRWLPRRRVSAKPARSSAARTRRAGNSGSRATYAATTTSTATSGWRGGFRPCLRSVST